MICKPTLIEIKNQLNEGVHKGSWPSALGTPIPYVTTNGPDSLVWKFTNFAIPRMVLHMEQNQHVNILHVFWYHDGNCLFPYYTKEIYRYQKDEPLWSEELQRSLAGLPDTFKEFVVGVRDQCRQEVLAAFKKGVEGTQDTLEVAETIKKILGRVEVLQAFYGT